MSRYPLLMLTVIAFALPGCAVYTVADTAVSVASSAVKATATVVETAVDVTASGVKAVTGSEKK